MDDKILKAVKAELANISNGPKGYAAIARIVLQHFSHLRTEDKGVFFVKSNNGPSLAIRIMSKGKFQTSSNKHNPDLSLLEFTQQPMWSADQLFHELATMNTQNG